MLHQLLVRDKVAVLGFESSEHVKGAGVGHPGGDGEVGERGAVELHRQELGLVVGHASDSKARIEFAHGLSEPVEVGSLLAHHTVGIFGRALGAMGSRGRSSA